jgi:hypothetical protein
MIGQWEKLFTPSTPFLMTPSSGESIGLAALRIMQVLQANRSSTFVCAASQGRNESPKREIAFV